MSLRDLSEATTRLLVSCAPVLRPAPSPLPHHSLDALQRRFGPLVGFLVCDLGPRVVAALRQRSTGAVRLDAVWSDPGAEEPRRGLEEEIARLLGRSPDLVLELRKLMTQIHRESAPLDVSVSESRKAPALPAAALWWHLAEHLGASAEGHS